MNEETMSDQTQDDQTQPEQPAGDSSAQQGQPERGAAQQGGRPAGQEPGTAPQDAEKDPETWVTGDEPMTGPQRSYLSTLAQEAGEDVPEGLTKAHASEMIDRLQSTTGRGQGS